MRRKDRQMSIEDAAAALGRAKWGVLSTCADGEPYGVPVNYVYSHEENAIFFHCAPKGKKTENIVANANVSFVAVTREQIIPEKLTTLYESIIASGTASIVEDRQEMIKRYMQLCEALAPGTQLTVFPEECLSASVIVRIDVKEITGKRNC